MTEAHPSLDSGMQLLDANVFVALVLGDPNEMQVADAVLRDFHGRIVASELIVLEVESVVWRKQRQGFGFAERVAVVDRVRRIFNQVGVLVPVDSQVIREARRLVAITRSLSAMDAIHAATALHLGAELVTFERTTKPFFQVPGLKCRSLHAAATGKRN